MRIVGAGNSVRRCDVPLTQGQNQQLTSATVADVAQQVVSEVAPSLEVVAGEGLSGIKFDEFNIIDATAWDVLKKLKEQGGITASRTRSSKPTSRSTAEKII